MKLHVLIGCPYCIRVMYALEALQLKYELVSYTGYPQLKTPEYLKMNPKGEAPVLETEQGFLYESSAILRYLASLNPEAGINGRNSFEAAQIEMWMLNVAPVSIAIVTIGVQQTGKIPANFAEHQTQLENLHARLSLLETHLEGKDFLVTAQVTLADFCLVSFLNLLFRQLFEEADRVKYPNVLRYWTQITDAPYYQKFHGVQKRLNETRFKLIAGPKEVKEHKEPKEYKPKQKKPAKQESPKVEKKEKAPEPEAVAPKEPETTFDLYGFKTLFVNEKDRLKVCQTAFDTYDKDHFSFWHAHYDMHPSEGKDLIPTSNLLTNFVSRVNDLGIGKNLVAVHGIFGEEPNLQINGLWFWKSKDFLEPLKEHPSCEYVKWTKLDPSNEADRNKVISYWSNIVSGEGAVDGLANKVLKIIK
jgi:elongation factor 1-gamma